MNSVRRIIIFAFALPLFVKLAMCSAGPVDTPLVSSPHVEEPSTTIASNRELLAHRFPHIVYLGGPFIRYPRIVTITFSGDDANIVSRLEQFGNTITRTSWWRTVVEGYCAKGEDCIGEGQPGLSVRLDETFPAEVHGVAVSALLRRHAQAGRLGSLDPNTVLLAYLPKGVNLTDAFAARYCGEGPRAFHRALRFDKLTIGFAVIPRCGDEAALTGTASHEILEVTTNPDTAWPGFAFVRGSDNLGFTAAGVEPVDPCGLLTRGSHQALESSFVVQRAWSNRAASLGHDPCVPASTERPYLALVPQEPTVRVKKEGDSVMITLTAAADRPVPPWTVSVVDLIGLQERDQYVEASIDKTLVTPGDTARLTLTLRKRHPKHLCIVGLVSMMDADSYLWPVAVVMP